MNDAQYTKHCEDLYSFISDVSKDAQGFRARFDYTQYTLVQLCVMLDEYCAMAETAIAEEKQWELRNRAELEETLQKAIETGAPDRATALRWLYEAGDYMYGWEDFCWDYGLGWDYNPITQKEEGFGWWREVA